MEKLFVISLLVFFAALCLAVDKGPCDGGNEFYPDPTNCSRFYHCSNGESSLKDCPAGLEWSQATLKCDYPEHVQCSVSPTPKPKPTPEPKPTPKPKPTPAPITKTTRAPTTKKTKRPPFTFPTKKPFTWPTKKPFTWPTKKH